MAIGKWKKYWDGQDRSTITKLPTFICDICNKEYEHFVGSYFALPPAGIIKNKIYVCSECIKNNYYEGLNLGTVLSDYEKRKGKDFIEELFIMGKIYLPRIFRLQRKGICKKLREQILKAYNYKCVKCESQDHLQIDHIKAYSKDGDDTPRNLRVLCRKCNIKKGAKNE